MAWLRSSLSTRRNRILFARAKRWIDPFGVGLLNLVTVAHALCDGAMPDTRLRGAAVIAHGFTCVRYCRTGDWREPAFRGGRVRGSTGAKPGCDADRRQSRPP